MTPTGQKEQQKLYENGFNAKIVNTWMYIRCNILSNRINGDKKAQ